MSGLGCRLGVMVVCVVCAVAAGGVARTSRGAPAAGHAHAHPTEGPHHGPLIELGREEYHAELVHDHAAGSVTIHILDAAATAAVPTSAKQAMLNLVVAGKPRQFRLEAMPQPADPAGTASAFGATGTDLCAAIDARNLRGRLNVEIAGKAYSGSVGLHTHAHGHD